MKVARSSLRRIIHASTARAASEHTGCDNTRLEQGLGSHRDHTRTREVEPPIRRERLFPPQRLSPRNLSQLNGQFIKTDTCSYGSRLRRRLRRKGKQQLPWDNCCIGKYLPPAEERSTRKHRVAAAVASATAFGSRATDPTHVYSATLTLTRLTPLTFGRSPVAARRGRGRRQRGLWRRGRQGEGGGRVGEGDGGVA